MRQHSQDFGATLLMIACAALVPACRGDLQVGQTRYQMFVSEPVGIMGTQTRLAVVLATGDRQLAQATLQAVEAELRRLEALMSTWIEDSEISRFNAAAAGEPVSLSADSLAVLEASRRLFEQTQGTFDVTCRPLIEGWRLAGSEGVMPTAEALAALRAESEWSQIEISQQTARKRQQTAGVDLSGIAKGYAIDQGVAVMRRYGASGGLVEVGGDLRVFGIGPGGGAWSIGVRSPFENRAWAEMAVSDAAVCTSGDYARVVEIADRKFSEIVDPRTGHPASRVSSATVVAADAMTADAWATALTVLGPAGLDLLIDQRIAALVVSDDEQGGYDIEASRGFAALLVSSEFEWQEREDRSLP